MSVLPIIRLTTFLLCASYGLAQMPTPPAPPPPVAKPVRLPGEVQPTAPGTRRATAIPSLTLTPPIPQLFQLQYLSNGSIEVAGAVVLLSPGDVPNARKIAALVVGRALAARPSLSEVDVSVYNRAGYGGFGGPLPILTLSAPRDRLTDVAAWAAGGRYERAWEASSSPPLVPDDSIADKVREETINFFGSVGDKLQDAGKRTASLQSGQIQDGRLYGGNPRLPIAALTFDDAPHPMYEPLLLDLLRREKVKATFFVIGRNARAYPYFVRDMVQQGHEIGNHTYHHVRLPPLPLQAAVNEMSLTNGVLEGITKQPIRFFRPPGGDYTPQTLSAAQSLGLTTVFWTDDPGDFQNPGDNVLESRFDRKLRPGGIILLHDNAQETLNVFADFLKVARQRQLHLTTISGMLSGKPSASTGR